jgi:hypothetical protein
MLDLRIARHRSRIPHKCRDLETLHSRGYIGNGQGTERLRDSQHIPESVDFDDVGNVAAPSHEPDDTAA